MFQYSSKYTIQFERSPDRQNKEGIDMIKLVRESPVKSKTWRKQYGISVLENILIQYNIELRHVISNNVAL